MALRPAGERGVVEPRLHVGHKRRRRHVESPRAARDRAVAAGAAAPARRDRLRLPSRAPLATRARTAPGGPRSRPASLRSARVSSEVRRRCWDGIGVSRLGRHAADRQHVTRVPGLANAVRSPRNQTALRARTWPAGQPGVSGVVSDVDMQALSQVPPVRRPAWNRSALTVTRRMTSFFLGDSGLLFPVFHGFL